MSHSMTFQVRGMTCDHCVRAVRTELARLPGVTEVAVDLDTGAVQVHGDQPLAEGEVAEAVEEAGYELVR